MEINRLSQEELVYSLAIRGLPIAKVDEMRVSLRAALKTEKDGRSFLIDPYPFKFEEDITALNKKIEEIRELLASFEGDPDSPEYRKILTKIEWALDRLQNVKTVDPEQSKEKSRVRADLIVALGSLQIKADGDDDEYSSDTVEDLSFTAAVMTNNRCRVPLNKWDVKFSGEPNQSLNAFLERVNELAEARGINKQQLFRSALDLFTGRALVWYRANRTLFHSWLVRELKKEFLPADYDDRLLEEIKRRTQGKNETIGMYVAMMVNMFSRLTDPLSEAQKVRILKRNISPFYQAQLGLTEIDSVQQLVELGRRLESIRTSVEAFIPPPSRRNNQLLEPDLAYAAADILSVSMLNNEPSTSRNGPKCFKCGLRGHITRFCRRNLSCYGDTTSFGKRNRSSNLSSDSSNPRKAAGRKDCELDVNGVGGKDKGTLNTLVDYVFTQVENDVRPHLSVSIFGLKFRGLLDSGATRTIVGGPGWHLLKNMRLKVKQTNARSVKLANGGVVKVLGEVSIPIELESRVKLCETLVIPDLPHFIILGIDFWRDMNIQANFRDNLWKFTDTECEYHINHLQSQSKLSRQEREELDEIINRAKIKMGTALGCTNEVKHVIQTDSAPIKQRYYPVSPAIQKVINEELDKMLEAEVVEPSDSAWASPVVIVRKKDGGYRFCVDFRKLNKVTKKDAYPLPYISATLDKLRDAKFLSSLDIKSAFWQIPVEESSKQYTAFTVPGRGLYQFRRMPFGLCNSPATWQRLIDRVLSGDLENKVFVYLDDVIVVTQSFEDHKRVLEKVLDRLHKSGLVINYDKCEFCRPELRYLGYIVGENGLQVDP